MSLDDLKLWVNERNSIPIDGALDTPFVLTFDFLDDGKFKFFMTTRRLLNIASCFRSLHIDGTFKLN